MRLRVDERARFALPVLAAGILACACIPPAAPEAVNADALRSDRVLLTGTIELAPPPRDTDYMLEFSTEWKGKAFLLDEQPGTRISARKLRGRIEVPLGKPFYVMVPREALEIRGIFIPIRTSMTTGEIEGARLPAGLRVAIRGDDRAVYAGHLRFTRDEFFQVNRVELLDEHALATVEVQRRFGAFVTPRRELFRALD